jgi:ABC-type Fe3+-siderophore transport system permease subunit
MGYDYQLVGGTLLLIFGGIGVANSYVDKRSPLYSLIGMLFGGALILWAWLLSGQTLTPQEIPNAIFRVLGYWF